MPSTITIEEIKSLFALTIFWNDVRTVDELLNDAEADAEHRETCEFPLQNSRPVNRAGRLLRYISGEYSADIAEVFVVEGDTCESPDANDAAFLAAIPVVVPALLRRIRDLEKEVSMLQFAIDEENAERQRGPIL